MARALSLLVLIAQGLLTGCSPLVVWTGHTPDRSARVRVVEEDKGQYVITGDSAGPMFDGVAPAGLAFSPDGRRMAYPARRGKKWTVVVDGGWDKWWDGIGEVLFSPDGGRLVFPVLDGTEWMVLLDGEPGPRFDSLLWDTFRFHPSTGLLSYAGQRGDSVFIVLETNLSPPFEDVSAPLFLPGGNQVAFVGRIAGKEHVVVDSRLGPGWEAVAGLVIHPVTGAPAYFGREGGRWYALFEEGRFGPWDAADGLTFSGGGEEWAFMARVDGIDRIVKSGLEGPQHQRILAGSLRLSPTGDAVAYIAGTGGAEHVIVAAQPGPEYSEVRMLDFGPGGGHYAYIGADSLGERVVVDGEPGPIFQAVADLLFSGDGETVGYTARDAYGGVAVIGSDHYRFPVVAEGSLVLGPEAKHWALVAGQLKSRELHFFVDGRDTGREFDWQELIDAQRPGPEGLPDLLNSGGLVRSWVHAEMERFLAGGNRGPR